jgi:hypothetical protein
MMAGRGGAARLHSNRLFEQADLWQPTTVRLAMSRETTLVFQVMMSLTDVLVGAKDSKLDYAYIRECTLVVHAAISHMMLGLLLMILQDMHVAHELVNSPERSLV